MAENEDTLEAGKPLCKLLKGHKLSKDIGDIILDIQEVELKGSGSINIRWTERERGKK